jgi:hypothetical protein
MLATCLTLHFYPSIFCITIHHQRGEGGFALLCLVFLRLRLCTLAVLMMRFVVVVIGMDFGVHGGKGLSIRVCKKDGR